MLTERDRASNDVRKKVRMRNQVIDRVEHLRKQKLQLIIEKTKIENQMRKKDKIKEEIQDKIR